MTETLATTDAVSAWLSEATNTVVGNHSLRCLTEIPGRRKEIIDTFRDICRSHYVAPEITAKRLSDLGAPQTAELLRQHLPTTKRARSGEVGEILAVELAERRLGFEVPIRRLRWKDGRDMALRGDDIVGVMRSATGPLKLLKGEAKSRANLTASVVVEASSALDRDSGRPTRHSVLFVADRLREQGRDSLAKDLEMAVTQSFRTTPYEHMLFTLSGNNPQTLLADHLAAVRKNPRPRHAIGVQINDHSGFIALLYSEM